MCLFVCWESTILPHSVLCVQTGSTPGAAELLGINRDSAPQRGAFHAEVQDRQSGDLSTATTTDGETQSSVGEDMSPCQSLEFYPTQRGKDTGVAIQLKRQIEAYENKWANANELPHGFWKALIWLCNSFCAKVVERPWRLMGESGLYQK